MSEEKTEGIPVLAWTQEKGWWRRRVYVLKHGESEVARLSWNKMIGTLATGRFGDKEWTFKRVGFLRPKVTVRVAGTQEDVATVEFRWNGAATIRTREGEEIRWRRNKRWGTEWAYVDQTDTPLLTLKTKHHLLGTEFQVQLLEYDLLLSKWPWLPILSAYTRILAQDDASASAVVVATS
jgi:hypothetical protein